MVADVSPTEDREAATEAVIARLVDAFYARVRADAVLGPIFNGAIADWDVHLHQLRLFWSSVMLGTGRYKGQPMPAHIRHAPHMTQENFARWLNLWQRTTDELLAPPLAAAFQEKAGRIAESLRLGVEFHRERVAR